MSAAAAADQIVLLPLSGFRQRDAAGGNHPRRNVPQESRSPRSCGLVAAPGLRLSITRAAPSTSACAGRTAAGGGLRANRGVSRGSCTPRPGEFGFHLSYPRDNPHGIAYEPWHWCWRAVNELAPHALNCPKPPDQLTRLQAGCSSVSMVALPSLRLIAAALATLLGGLSLSAQPTDVYPVHSGPSSRSLNGEWQFKYVAGSVDAIGADAAFSSPAFFWRRCAWETAYIKVARATGSCRVSPSPSTARSSLAERVTLPPHFPRAGWMEGPAGLSSV